MNVFSHKFMKHQFNDLKLFFADFNFEFQNQQYALWSLKTPDFKAVLYESGKLVIQGSNINNVVNSLSNEFKIEINNSLSTETLTSNQNFDSYIGVDESGKGDFFGPLIIAGVCINEENKKLFIDMGIKDSKKLNDKIIQKYALEIKKNSVWSIVNISPGKYNELYYKFKNLNKLLAWGHARVIENILEKYPCQYALSDKFGNEKLIKDALMQKGKKIILEQKIKAESDIAVACASVLARDTFVTKLNELSIKYKIDFPKGASSCVIIAGKKFKDIWGIDNIKNVAKTHFKTYLEL